MNIRAFLVRAELNRMSSYLDLVRQAIDQKLEDIEKEYHQLDIDEASMLDDEYLDLYLDTGREFPQLLLTSFIIAWYSFVERHLLILCEDLKLTITISPRDQLNIGKGIRQAKFFLATARKYDIDHTHWQELVRIGKLRNKLVHSDTRLSVSLEKPNVSHTSHKFSSAEERDEVIYIHIDKDLFQYLDKQNIIEQTGSHSYEIRPTFDYCEYLIDFGLALFSKIYVDINPANSSLFTK